MEEQMSKGTAKAVMPMITVNSVDALRTFYVDKLGFTHMMGVVGKDGQFDFCTVVRDGAKVMLMRPQERMDGAGPSKTKRPVEIYLEVSDVDAVHEDVRKRGVRAIWLIPAFGAYFGHRLASQATGSPPIGRALGWDLAALAVLASFLALGFSRPTASASQFLAIGVGS